MHESRGPYWSRPGVWRRPCCHTTICICMLTQRDMVRKPYHVRPSAPRFSRILWVLLLIGYTRGYIRARRTVASASSRWNETAVARACAQPRSFICRTDNRPRCLPVKSYNRQQHNSLSVNETQVKHTSKQTNQQQVRNNTSTVGCMVVGFRNVNT